MIKTVLGDVKKQDLGITLAHEHICCYSEYLYKIANDKYLDKCKLINTASDYLALLKEKYGLNTLVDCTPVNLGRDVDLLKNISEKSGVNIVCSTGFYYTDEPVLYNTPAGLLTDYMIEDARKVNAGIIKCAVENENISEFSEKLLRVSASVHKALGLPIVVHTNADNQNGLKALSILLSEGVKPSAITVGHLSDTEDFVYIRSIAESGCFIGLDRLYDNCSEKYISKKIETVAELCDAGYEDKILLYHDALFFNGFEEKPTINKCPRFSYCFDNILPKLSDELKEKFIEENPKKMLRCGE